MTINNNLFSWCNSFAEARTNYNTQACISLTKNHIARLNGADVKFREAVAALAPNQFTVNHYYFPVYDVTAVARYTWDTTEYEKIGDTSVTTKTKHTETQELGDYYAYGIYNSCQITQFVGSNDTRLYRVNLPSELPYPLYNSNCAFYSSDMQRQAAKLMEKNSKGRAATLLSWNCRIIFVPIACVSFMYQGKRYTNTINMHNGKYNCEFVISQVANENATSAYNKARIFKIAYFPIAIAWIIYTLYAMFGQAGSIGWDILLLVLAGLFIGVTFLFIRPTLKFNLAYFKGRYGVSDQAGKDALSSVVTPVIFLAVGCVVCVVAHILLCL